ADARRGELARDHAAAVAQLADARTAAGFAEPELRRLLSADPSRIDALAERLAALDRGVERTRTVMQERERHVADHAATRPSAVDALDLDAAEAREAGAEGDHAGMTAR